MLLVHWRDVIEPVEIRNRLQIGLMLDQFFGAAVKQTDVRVDALDDFAVKFKHETQHPVSRRMLRTEIDREVALAGFGHHATCAIFAAFAASRAWNLSHITTKRSCRPSPMRSMPS